MTLMAQVNQCKAEEEADPAQDLGSICQEMKNGKRKKKLAQLLKPNSK
jgi:hypothetical protein